MIEEKTTIGEMEVDSVSANVIYNSFLKNEDTSENLLHLVNQAEDFNSKKSDYDIIKEYLQTSRSCQELLQLIKDWSKSDLKDAVSLMKVLCHILIRVASDLNIYAPAGASLVNEILAYGMKTVFNFLQFKQKSSRTKLALHLLASMVALGKITAFKVVSKLNFSHANFFHLLNKRNFSEEEDARTAFLNFIVLILSKCDNNVIRQIVEIKGFLNSIIPGLLSDRPGTIVLVLTAFRHHIVENPSISKNSKLHLFNDHSLKPIIQLYLWKGPLRNKKNKKRKLGEEDNPVAFEVTDEEASDVHKTVHEFMLALCCSHKNGIINKDPSFGLTGKNMNPVVSNILKECPKPYMDPKMSEFVLSVLQACPDQLKLYISVIKDNFSPRLSQSWLDMCNFLKKLMLSQDPITVLFHSENKHTVSTLLDIGSTVCLLDAFSAIVVKNTIVHRHHVLSYYLYDILLCICNQAMKILNFSGDQKIYESSDIEKFKKSFRSLISLRLSISEELHFYLKQLTEITQKPDVPLMGDVAIPSLAEKLLLLFKLMRAVKEISPENFVMNWPAIFSSLKKCDDNMTREELNSVYACVIDILADDDYPILGNLNTSDSLLLIVGDVLVDCLKSNPPNSWDIVYKIFLQTKIFDRCKWEVPVWLSSMKKLKNKHIYIVLKFINMSLQSLFNDPGKFSDFSVQSSSSSVKQNGDMSNCEQPSNLTEYAVSTNKWQSYSNFLLVALDQLKSLRKEERKCCQLFLEEGATHIMHHQYDQLALYSAIEPYKSFLNSSIVKYFELLSIKRHQISVVESFSASKCTLDLVGHLKQNFIFNLSSETELETCSCDISALLENLDQTSIRLVIWQVLTYLHSEVTAAMEKGTEETTALSYINLLEQFINCLSMASDSLPEKCDATSTIKDFELSPQQQKFEILKEVLDHPVMIKLFLRMPTNSFKRLQSCSLNATKIVENIVREVVTMNDKSFLNILHPYKDKIMEALSEKSYCDSNELDLNALIVTFASLFDTKTIKISLEKMVCATSEHVTSSEESIRFLFTLMDLYFQSKDTLPLSPRTVNFLILKYVVASKKQRKELRKILTELFTRYPVTALFLNEDSSQQFIQNWTSKDLPILRILISTNKIFRGAVRNFIIETSDIESIPFIYLSSSCLNMCCNKEELDIAYKEAVSSRLWKTLTTLLLDEADFEEALKMSGAGQAVRMLIVEKYISLKKLSKFSKNLLEQSEKVVPSLSKLQIILQILESWKHVEGEKDKGISLSLKTGLCWLVNLMSTDFNFWELTNFLQELLKDASDLILDELIDVQDFFVKLLKISFKCETIGKEILKILCLVCEKCQPESLPVQNLYSLVSGHSKFFQTMVAENSDKSILKECLVDLLIILIELDGSLCKENHIGLYLSSYGGTMSSVDQKILYLIKLYADNNINMIRYRPFLWGKQAVTHYSIMNDSHLFLWKQPKLQDVLGGFLVENIELTLLNFPLKATLLPSRQVFQIEKEVSDKIYDFRYYLPQIATLFSPGSFVHCNTVLESKILMLVFVSLSSFDTSTRAVGYYCLSSFYHHLEGANFKEKDVWMCLLESLRNSINSPNPRLPSIISIFLARIVDIFTRPDHFMFVPLYKFITAKPCLDITQVPEYFKLFNNLTIDHRAQRLWLLSFICDGLQTSLDFHICEKRYIFRNLMTHYNSCMSTEPEKIIILKTIQNAVKICSTARTLCNDGLLLWLNNVIEDSNCTKSEITDSLCSIMDNLISTAKCSYDEDSKTAFDISYEFTLVLFTLLKKLSFPDFLTVKKCILTLLKSLTAANKEDNVMPQLSMYHVMLLLKMWKYTVKNIEEDENCLKEDQETKKCFQSFAEIITHWDPLVNSENDNVCDKMFDCICDVLELLSVSFENSSFYLHDFPQWLHKCVVKLNNQRLEQFLLTRDSFKLILKLYEKTLLRFVIEKELKEFSSSSLTNSWNILLHCFNELPHPELVWFKHICDAVSS